MNNNIIETYDLTKKFKLKGGNKEILALNKINISIRKGEIFGLLGPNGAGKTTMVQILTTLLQPTSGYAIVDGYNILKKPKQIKSRIGLMLGNDMIYHRITGYDNLKFFAKIYNISNYKQKINDLAEEFGIKKWLNQYVENFSSGMEMKLALCRILLLEPKIYFLDEPTLGLDLKSILYIIDRLKNLKRTIFLTSHNMSVVEKLCNRIAFINNGNILKIGTQEDIKRLIKTEIKIEIEIVKNKNQLYSELMQQNFLNDIIDKKNGFLISLKERKYYKELFSILSKYDVLKINEQKLSLEDLFLKIIS